MSNQPIFLYYYAYREKYVCSFDKILRFYDYQAPYMTDSFSNQSPFSLTVQRESVKMSSKGWFMGSKLARLNKGSSRILYATDGRDMIKLIKDNGEITGYGGTMDSYIKLFYFNCFKA